MTNLLTRSLRGHGSLLRGSVSSWDDYAQFFNGFTFNGVSYGGGITQTLQGTEERIETDFGGLVAGAYKRNGVVFACMLARILLFSEARFAYRERTPEGRPGDLSGGRGLALLERPWTNATTGDLLTRMLQDADLAGNSFTARRATRLRRMRPDWVTIVLGSESDPALTADDLDAEVIGYMYQPGGPLAGNKPVLLMPEEVAHFAPIPDPAATYRGMSWLLPVLREIQSDGAATEHKQKFFENGATPNLVVSLDASVTPEKFRAFKLLMDAEHKGLANAYKTLYLGGGAEPKVVGATFEQMAFKATQGAGETRIAAAAGVPPVIVGLSEGLQAATYSNYGQARRRFADGTMRPLWRNAAGSLAHLIDVPADRELWYDDRDIAFLAEDRKDAAEIQNRRAHTIKGLVDAGFTPDSVISAVQAEDFARLVHTGLYSVQLQAPGTTGAGKPKAEPVHPKPDPSGVGPEDDDTSGDEPDDEE